MSHVRPNRLLQALPEPYRTQLVACLEEVELPVSTVLYLPDDEPKYAHFMTSGITSIVTYMEGGSGVEVGLIGTEGVVQAFHLLGSSKVPTSGFIQVAGSALRLPYRRFKDDFMSVEALRMVGPSVHSGSKLGGNPDCSLQPPS